MLRLKCLLLFALSVALCVPCFGQAWSGILASSRAITWTPGVTGGIPTGYTQCGSTIVAYNGSATTINNAIAACGAQTYVLLGAGTFNLTSGINIQGQSQVILRGSGPSSTFLVFTGNVGCLVGGSSICVTTGYGLLPATPAHTANWTAGYSAGTTVITLSSTTGLANGDLLVLDQCNTGLSGATCATGTETDNGNFWVCSASTACSQQGDANVRRAGRSQVQVVQITNIAGNNITITPGLYASNWASGQNPGAYWDNVHSVFNVGVENLSIDNTNCGCFSGFGYTGVRDSWIKNVRSLFGNRAGIWFYGTEHMTVRDSYIYGTINAASQSYGIETDGTGDCLVENNIAQATVTPWVTGEATSGCVYGYNFAVNDFYGVNANWMQSDRYFHSSGVNYTLFEGNIGPGITADDLHGSSDFGTYFRNRVFGVDTTSDNPTQLHNTKNLQTDAIQQYANNRYFNYVGNVLGFPSFHTTYQNANATTGDSCANPNLLIYAFGYAGNCGPAAPVNNDSLALSTSMRWGNYDTVNNANRFVSGEVPSGISLYPNPVPGNNNLPPSFYLSNAATNGCGTGLSFWKNPASGTCPPFPPIGPDVTSGTLGVVTSGTYALASASCVTGITGCANVGTTAGGHANANPAMLCYLNIMHGPPDGTGGALAFDAANCYQNDPVNAATCPLNTTTVGWTWGNGTAPCACKYVGLGLVDNTAGGANNATVCQKYGGTYSSGCNTTGNNNWAQAQSYRLQNLGFNAADWYSYRYYSNWPANGVLYVQSVPTSGYAMRDAGDDSVTGSPWHVKDTLNIPNTATMKCGPQVYRGQGSVDPYDPNYSGAVTNMMAALGSASNGYASQAHAMATIVDETDNMVGFEEANNPNYAHTDLGYVIAAQSPTQAQSPAWAKNGSNPNYLYTDHEFYAKQAMEAFLLAEYGTIAALNAAWGTSYTTFGTSDAGGLAGITAGTYSSWGTGTGFLDEAGFGIFNTNAGTNPNLCGGANGNGPTQGLDAWGKTAQVKIDADAFVYALTAKYASTLRTAYIAGCGSTCPPEIIPIYDGPLAPSTASVYAAAAPYVDVFMVAPYAYSSVGAVQTEVQNIINADGGAPVIFENYLQVHPDSVEGGTCAGADAQDCQTTQALRGSLWANLNSAVLRLKNPSGKYAVIGFSHWLEYADSLAQELFTANDNAYDGSQSSTLTGVPSACQVNHAYTQPAQCTDPNGNYESLRVASCTSAGSGTSWPSSAAANFEKQTTDGSCKWFDVSPGGIYPLTAEGSNFGNSLGAIADFQTSNLCDPLSANPTAPSSKMFAKLRLP